MAEESCHLLGIPLGLPAEQGRAGWGGDRSHPLSPQQRIPIDCALLTWHSLEELVTESLKAALTLVASSLYLFLLKPMPAIYQV